MLDRLIAFCLLAHAVQAAILVADTKGWLSGSWRLELARRLSAWRASRPERS